jgi:hypothetical protein
LSVPLCYEHDSGVAIDAAIRPHGTTIAVVRQ